MINGLLARKIGMTQIFDKEGNLTPVTVLEVGPCTVLELSEEPKKVKVGFEVIKESKVSKPGAGYFKKIGVNPMRQIKEFSSTNNEGYEVGKEISVDIFKRGDAVDITGTSIGKGFQGGMKRWNWDGGPAGHGSRHHRRVGSIGASADPARTLRGTNMPGQMGNETKTAQGLRVCEVDIEKNLLLVKGAVPSHKNALVIVRLSKKTSFRDLDEVRVRTKHKVNPMKQSKAKGKG